MSCLEVASEWTVDCSPQISTVLLVDLECNLELIRDLFPEIIGTQIS